MARPRSETLTPGAPPPLPGPIGRDGRDGETADAVEARDGGRVPLRALGGHRGMGRVARDPPAAADEQRVGGLGRRHEALEGVALK